jgi:hypothetical protein
MRQTDSLVLEVQIKWSLLDNLVHQRDAILLLGEQFQEPWHQAEIPARRKTFRVINPFPDMSDIVSGQDNRSGFGEF